MLTRKFLYFLLLLLPINIVSGKERDSLEISLKKYLEGVDARVGVAVITSESDTVSVNGNESFPMLSVYKFPQALVVADFCIKNKILFTDSIFIDKSELLSDTYSPLRDKYGIRDLKLPIQELLSYSLQLSDNNACDILFRLVSGTVYADSVITELGFPNTHLLYTEDEMHKDLNNCYKNYTTPVEMVKLLALFKNELREKSDEYRLIGTLMESCSTGTDRLANPLGHTDIIGHKTGTGDRNNEGKIIGVNDDGYIISGDKLYFIAVLVSDSGLSMAETTGIISGLSEIVAKFH